MSMIILTTHDAHSKDKDDNKPKENDLTQETARFSADAGAECNHGQSRSCAERIELARCRFERGLIVRVSCAVN